MHIDYPCITQFQHLVEPKDYRKPTRKEPVRYDGELAEHFQCDPANLTENQLRAQFLGEPVFLGLYSWGAGA